MTVNEYDEVELMADQPQWQMRAGARGAVVAAVAGEDAATIEFYGPDEENVVHLVPIRLLRVTDPYATAAPADTAASRF